MLVKRDYTDKYKSRYICDRCKKELKFDERFVISVGIIKTGVTKKKYDFCIRCYRALENGVEKGRTNKC